MSRRLLILVLLIAQPGFSQDDLDLDLQELDKVEQEEFGDAENAENSDFDLELDNKQQDKVNAQEDFEKEFENLEGEGEGDANVKLEDELDKPAEEVAQPEELPPLETPAPQEETPPAPVVETPPEEIPEPAPEPESAPEVVQAPEPVIDDSPNSEFESRLGRIFEKFNSERLSDDEWAQIAGPKASETYAVQVGDTLWDISVTFFGSGYFWPKIWQLNNDITNPHVIQPGRMIRFTPGDLESAPEIQVTESDGSAVETEVAEAELSEEVDPSLPEPDMNTPVIPPPIKTYTSVLKPIPNSFPVLDEGIDSEYDQLGFALEKKASNISQPSVFLMSYMSEKLPNSVGEVVGIETGGETTAGTYQYIFVRLREGQEGSQLTAWEAENMIENEQGVLGYPIILQGSIKVLERVNDTQPVYRALVTRAISQVKVGAKLSGESIPKVTLIKENENNSVSGRIVGGQSEARSRLFGTNSIIYLDVGSADGVKVGDTLTVVRNEKTRDRNSLVTKSTRSLGKVKIAFVTNNRATGIILHSNDSIFPGDLIGGFDVKNSAQDDFSKLDSVESAAPADGEPTEESLSEEELLEEELE